MIERLLNVIHEPRNNTHFRVMLLASGGNFAGCVFDGNSVVAHKTFHRYVIRAKSGKKQSSKDASGKITHSAGASIRRHNELSLKKDIRDLLATWKPYFDASSCIFIHGPSDNRQLLFDDERGKTPYMLATEKEVRNMFRRFMALNLDKWDWEAAKAEKDAKRKARAKELKKLKKANEKKAEVEAAQSQKTSSTRSQCSRPRMSKEESIKQKLDALPVDKQSDEEERNKIFREVVGQDGHGRSLCMGTGIMKSTKRVKDSHDKVVEEEVVLLNEKIDIQTELIENQQRHHQEQLENVEKRHKDQMENLEKRHRQEMAKFYKVLHNTGLVNDDNDVLDNNQDTSDHFSVAR